MQTVGHRLEAAAHILVSCVIFTKIYMVTVHLGDTSTVSGDHQAKIESNMAPTQKTRYTHTPN